MCGLLGGFRAALQWATIQSRWGRAQENPAHGILDLWFDGNVLGSFDWCGPRTIEKTRSMEGLGRPHTLGVRGMSGGRGFASAVL